MKAHVQSGQKGRRTLGIIGALLVLQAVLVAAFVLPQHKPEPHDIPVGVVASAAVADEIEAAHPAELDVRAYASESPRTRRSRSARSTAPSPAIVC